MIITAGFPPIAGAHARVLILGTLPSQKSLEYGQYYGHPRNAFWPIMGELVGAGPDLPYAERTAVLAGRRLAVWDVLASSVRPGSMDAAIERTTARANDFEAFLHKQPDLQLVCFNGQAAATLFRKLVADRIAHAMQGIRCATLPSTSPAYAAMGFADKLKQWSQTLACAIDAD